MRVLRGVRLARGEKIVPVRDNIVTKHGAGLRGNPRFSRIAACPARLLYKRLR